MNSRDYAINCISRLVWIHGGGYTLGWKTQYGTGGGLIKASNGGIIYVAINYRLGIFVNLSSPLSMPV